jgi:hypothetical protein
LKLRMTLMATVTLFLILTACLGGVESNPMLDVKGKKFVLQGVSDLQQIAQLTGADSVNATDRYVVYGTDLGSMINEGDRTYFVFGDTFGERNPTLTGAGGNFWRSNVLAYTTDSDPADGITFDGMITDEFGLAKELLPSAKVDYEEMTKIPTHGLYANEALYLYYMSVNHWGLPGEWDVNYASIAKSTDQGQSWALLDTLKWPRESNFIQVSPYKVESNHGDSDFYFWCIPSGRFGGVKLMKVSESNIENLAEYRYYTGTDDKGLPQWDTDLTKAKLVVDDRVGELSVVWNPYLERWLMTYSIDGAVVIREGLAPWGPWGEAIELVKAIDYPGLYAPYMNDRYVGDDGRTIYFSLSLWDPYNVFWFKASLENTKADS